MQGIPFFWPDIVDEKAAQQAAKYGWYAALCISATTIVSIILKWTSAWSMFDIVLISLAGYGCLKMSRTAAVLGMILCVVSGFQKYSSTNSFGMMFIFFLLFANAARGCFEYHKMKKAGGLYNVIK